MYHVRKIYKNFVMFVIIFKKHIQLTPMAIFSITNITNTSK